MWGQRAIKDLLLYHPGQGIIYQLQKLNARTHMIPGPYFVSLCYSVSDIKA